MPHTVESALGHLSERYQSLWLEKLGGLPQSVELADMPSPCIQRTQDDYVEWCSVVREIPERFENVENGIELTLHSDIKAFYGTQYSADIQASWQGNNLTLLQVWSDEDMTRLQENMLGHLVMQKRLKLKPTMFIAATDDEMEVVSICNLSGQVILETVGTSKRLHLADTLEEFLNNLQVEVMQ